MALFSGSQAHDRAGLYENSGGTERRIDRHFLVLFVWDDVVPPAQGGAKCDDESDSADHPVRNQTRTHQSDSESEYHRPGGGRGELDMRLFAAFSRFAVMCLVRHVINPLSADDVHDRENDDPDRVHKMPI